MSDPSLWYAFTALFALAGLLNLVRGLRRTDARRPVSLAMGVAGFLWAACAALFRFGPSHAAAYGVGALAAATMLYGAFLGAKAAQE